MRTFFAHDLGQDFMSRVADDMINWFQVQFLGKLLKEQSEGRKY